MRMLSFLEIQKVGNSILTFLKEICDEHNIKFYLAYGTVIGAIRHHGFIPWDDDIDVYFTRLEFNKLMNVMQEIETPYRIMSVITDNVYCHPLTKLVDTRTQMNWHIVKHKPNYGVWVDLYILDNVPDNDLVLRLYQLRMDFLQKCYEHSLYYYRAKTISQKLKKYLLEWTNLLGPRFFSLRLVKLSQKFNNTTTSRFAPNSFTAASRKGAVLDKEIIGEGVEMEFEGNNYLVPVQTDRYLRHFYGDYLTLPPEEKRVSNHSADFYYI